ncbi:MULTISPECIES: BolA family protein [unclassified Motilimonas]|uniref:BolA family protein n=1 Tax=Motilimonas TaxID=1914248 RepID=UPI001E551ECA|nr:MULTISPECIES: BolA family protein [unclassified Motilimonas]MCE0555772.1 BolA family transcriptional regulator [Motilimonas sp. E26]MDO6524179.1 BolA family protein [Motilimonas sp. 1_MG-2023]
MDPKEIEAKLLAALPLEACYVKGEGSHFQVIAVSDMFADMSRVKKQQAIYAPLMEEIAANTIHALSIKAFTPQQWQKEKIFNQPS